MSARAVFSDADIGRAVLWRPVPGGGEIEGEFRGVVQEDHTGKVKTIRVKFCRGCQLVQASRCSWLRDGR